MKYTDSELQIMEILWSATGPLSAQDILAMSPEEKSWKDNSLFIMMQMLLKKDAIREVGAVKAHTGKYQRVFAFTLSREEYHSAQLTKSIDEAHFPALFSALLNSTRLSEETLLEMEEIINQKKKELVDGG